MDNSVNTSDSTEELEQAIERIWKETFKLAKIDAVQNFFELGGNSLIGMEVMDKIAARLGLQLPVVLLFQNPTPRQMAECIQTLDGSDLGPY